MWIFSWKYFIFFIIFITLLFYIHSSWDPFVVSLISLLNLDLMGSLSTLASLAIATPTCIWPFTVPVPKPGHSYCLLFVLPSWKALLTVSLLWTSPPLLIISVFIHPLTVIMSTTSCSNLSYTTVSNVLLFPRCSICYIIEWIKSILY